MTIQVYLNNGDGSGQDVNARVSQVGQLIVAPYAYDDTVFKLLDVADTAYNFYKPKTGFQFVITLIRLKADRDVSTTTDAIVIIYEADADDSTTETKILHEELLVRGESATLNTNILVNAGKYINAKTSDDDIPMTIMGYYIPKLS